MTIIRKTIMQVNGFQSKFCNSLMRCLRAACGEGEGEEMKEKEKGEAE